MRQSSKKTTRERRRQQRLTAAPTTLRSATGEALLVDFNRHGFALETTTGLRPGYRQVFRLQGSGPTRPLVGFVRWSQLRTVRRLGNDEFEPVFHSGLSLEEDASG